MASLSVINREAELLLNFAFAAILTLSAGAWPSGALSVLAPRHASVATAPDTVVSSVPAIASRPSAPVVKTSDLGVFRSVAISAARLPAGGKWQAARQVDYAPMFRADCEVSGLNGCDSRFATKIRGLAGQVAGLSDRAMLDLVNRTVNGAMTYRADEAVWGVSDYWATPIEMARKGAGDCEDFAIAKYWALRSLGMPDDKLQLVLLQDTRRQLFHAVLVVHTGSGAYVLDNVSNRLMADTDIAQYQPIMSFAGGRSYIHGFAGNSRAVADMPKDLAAVAPGLGL